MYRKGYRNSNGRLVIAIGIKTQKIRFLQMYKVNVNNKTLTKLTLTDFTSQNILERYDIQEWIEKTPEILGEEFLIIGKELLLASGSRLDLLAIDKKARLTIIELKRDDSGKDVDWQSIRYTSYCSNFLVDEIISHYANYLNSDDAGNPDYTQSWYMFAMKASYMF